ncbi:MAG: hypothetical protein Fur007_04750 [Rhodoferax sp.]
MDLKALQSPSLIAPDDAAADVAALRVESMGWLPLDAGVYWHAGNDGADEITVVGVPRADQDACNVLWLLA